MMTTPMHPDIARLRDAAAAMRAGLAPWHPVADWLTAVADEAERHAAAGWGNCPTEVTRPHALAVADTYLKACRMAGLPRPNTPDRRNPDGSTTIRVKRACNGCGETLGDLIDRDVDKHGRLTDVRDECPVCTPALEETR